MIIYQIDLSRRRSRVRVSSSPPRKVIGSVLYRPFLFCWDSLQAAGEMTYFVYIIQSEIDGNYYIGSTHHLEDRLKKHNQGRSKYTKNKRHWKFIYFEEYPKWAKG